jgi:hypothetical protein
LASSITALTKPRTRSSFRMRSVVAPVKALMGLTVMLPHSLNQMSFWICGDTVAAKPARCSSAASACTRGLSAARGLAHDQPVAEVVADHARRIHRAAGVHHAADHVARGNGAGDLAGGVHRLQRRPASAPPKPSRNHQGTPFMAVSTMVSGPISGAMWRATSSRPGP